MTNYIPDVNKFKLAGPPQWFLRSLWEFDPSLAIVPSRQACVYRLCQRRKLNLPEHVTNEALFNESDTKMLASYGLIPVTSILATANWSNPYLFEELRKRAPWRLGGAEKVINKLESAEAQEELEREMKVNDYLTSLSRDSWGLYNKMIGLRTHMYSPRMPKRAIAPTGQKAPSIRLK